MVVIQREITNFAGHCMLRMVSLFTLSDQPDRSPATPAPPHFHGFRPTATEKIVSFLNLPTPTTRIEAPRAFTAVEVNVTLTFRCPKKFSPPGGNTKKEQQEIKEAEEEDEKRRACPHVPGSDLPWESAWKHDPRAHISLSLSLSLSHLRH